MNLHAIARGAVNSVNPDTPATLLRSNGYTTAADGKQVPAFLSDSGDIQVQGVAPKDLVHMNALNIQGVARVVYLRGHLAGIVRADQKGGDILNFPQEPGGAVASWKVVSIKETWPDWCSAIVVLQNTVTTA